MTQKEKTKKSLLRRILKWTGISFLLLIVILILIPIFFKNQIKDLVIKEANKSLLAEVSLGDFDLTFISTFPHMTIELDDAKITGTGDFKGVELANIKQFSAHVNFWSVIGGDKVEVEAIHLYEPSFDVRILNNGKANYDIVKPDSLKTPEEKAEPSKFELKLKEYSINNANIRYDDQVGEMFTELRNMTHIGTGDLTADVIDFNTTTTMDEMTFEMSGISYLKKVKTGLNANILMEFTDKSSKFTLKENEMSLNALHFSIDGFYEMFDKYDNMDLKLKADQATFKDFLSLIPTFYQSGYESMVAQGDLAFKGEIKGKMDDKNMPGWDFGLNVDKAKIKYPDLPGSIDNIVVKASSQFAGGADMDKMTVDVPKFHADFVGNILDATLKMRNLMTDPLIDSRVLAKVNLATLGKVIPLSEGESYHGKLDADVVLNGRESALEKGDFEAFKATGKVLLSDMLYKSKDLPTEVAIKTMLLHFSPQNVTLESLDAKMGKSDFQMAGTIDNYMAYIFRGDLLKGNFIFKSNNLDLDELMGATTTTSTPADTAKAATTTTESEPFLIPNNVDFNMRTSIANVKYNGMNIKNINGGVNLKEEVATLDNLAMNAMGGSIVLNGKYDTKEHTKPLVNFGYDLKDVDIKQLAQNFLTIQKLAPIAQYSSGKISSKFEMKSALKPSMEPVYNTLTGSGDLFSNMVSISGFKPLEKIAEVTKMEKLSKQTIKDLKAAFKFSDGKVTLTPFDVKLGKVVTNISGSSSFEKEINYVLKMNVPKEEIPASMIKVVEDQLKKINNLVPKLDLNVIPDVIPVKVNVGGTVTDPKVTTDFKESLLKATGNLKDNLKNTGKEILNQAKDSAKAIINDKINDVKEDLNAKKQDVLNNAQKQADMAKTQAKQAADAIRTEADREAKSLMDEAGSNPIKKKAAEVAGNKLKKTEYDKAQKLEDDADKKADAIMQKAKDDADKIK